MQAIGADGVNPVTWSFTENYSIPEGFTLTQDGLLTGKYPAQHNSTEWIYITATNGEQTASDEVVLSAYDPIDVTVNLSDGVTLVDGPAGEKSMNIFALNTWTFTADLDDLQLCDVRLTKTYSDGEEGSISSDYYTLRGNTLLLNAEALSSNQTLTVEPIYAKNDLDVIETATPLTFPYEETITHSSYVYSSSWENAYDSVVYKADLKVGQKVDFTWAHPDDESVDTVLAVFTKEEAGMSEAYHCDSDNVGEYGESGAFIAAKDATYYIFIMTYSPYSAVDCKFTATLSESTLPKNPHLTELLDFTDPDNLPEADKDGCWTWDAATKTLTLKDGFTMFVADDEAIILPENATLKVDGKATIAADNDVLSGLDNLTVELGKKADLTLISLQDETIDLNKGLLKINGKGTSRLTTHAYSDDNIVAGDYNGEEYDPETDTYIPIIDRGTVEIKDTILMIECDEDAIEACEGNITLDNCKVTIQAGSDGFLTDYYFEENLENVITLNDCTVNATCDDQVFDAVTGSVVLKNCYTTVSGYCVFDVWDAVTVEGGRLVAEAIDDSPVAWFNVPDSVTEDTTEVAPKYFTVKDATFYLTTEYDTFTNATDISLPGNLVLVDRDNNRLYTGEWDEEAIGEVIDPENGIYPTLIASIFTPGDVNEDDAIDAKDALMVLRCAVNKIQLTANQKVLADVSGNSDIDAKDALMILQYAVEKIDQFPVPTVK